MSKPVEIGIFGPRFDDEVQVLSRALRERGARVQAIDLTGLTGVHRLEVADDTVTYDGKDLGQTHAFYIRRTRYPLGEMRLLKASESAEARYGVRAQWQVAEAQEREVSALIRAAISLLDRPVVNPLNSQMVHPRKVHHLQVLAAAGVPVPPFVAGNDAKVIQAFVRQHDDAGVVVKPLRGLLKTQRFDPDARLPLLERPVMIQRYVRGVTVRVYAVAGRSIAAGALSNRGHVDSSVNPLPVQLVFLSDEDKKLVAIAARAVDLPFTGMDLIRPSDGGPSVVLECNAAPMFANFYRRTGADVAGPLADYLIRRARGGAVWEPGE